LGARLLDGEEAYSLAMLIQEESEKLAGNCRPGVRTDIDHESIEKARSAIYPVTSPPMCRPSAWRAFFTQEQQDFYRVKKTLRDKLIFAEQDVVKDPPFSKLDLISCRNMLIYMERSCKSG